MSSNSSWAANPCARPFRIERTQYKKNGLVRYKVRAFSGVVWRKANGDIEQVRCSHAHTKASSALKCAESVANRMNHQEREAQQ